MVLGSKGFEGDNRNLEVDNFKVGVGLDMD